MHAIRFHLQNVKLDEYDNELDQAMKLSDNLKTLPSIRFTAKLMN